MGKIEIKVIDSFEIAWKDQGSGGSMDGAFYNPNVPLGFHSIGSYGQSNYAPPSGTIVVVKAIEEGAIQNPIRFELVYNDRNSGSAMDGSFWLPIPPDGYTAMGILCVSGYNEPPTSSVVCLRNDLVSPADVGTLIWNDHRTASNMDGSFWHIRPTVGTSIQTGAFAGANGYDPAKAAPLFAINLSAVINM